MRAALLALVLVGCGTIQPHSASGNFVTTQHGTVRFADAMQGAADYCASRGMGIKHVSTTAQGIRPISSFECVPR
jgi:hypothetical protein